MKGILSLTVLGLVAAGDLGASPLGIQPTVGVTSEFASNPELRVVDARAEKHTALLLEAPLNYDLDSLQFAVLPSARISDSSGYASLASNYFRLSTIATRRSEIGAATLSAGFSRDSSLIHSGESINGIGVRRDTRSAELDLNRVLGERMKADAGVSWTRTTYEQPSGGSNLTSYRYLSAAPTLTYIASERNTFTVGGDIGRYRSLDGISSSNSSDVQIGFNRDLTELWSVATSFGYSRSKNSLNFFVGPFYLGTLQSTQQGTIYSLRLQRKGERLSLSANGSRALRPTGFAYLSRQDAIEFSARYEYSERWSFNVHAQFNQTADPQPDGAQRARRNYGGDASASWYWTPNLRVSLRASRYRQRFDSGLGAADSNGVALEITQQFNRMDL